MKLGKAVKKCGQTCPCGLRSKVKFRVKGANPLIFENLDGPFLQGFCYFWESPVHADLVPFVDDDFFKELPHEIAPDGALSHEDMF
jgi:hypothetical protein